MSIESYIIKLKALKIGVRIDSGQLRIDAPKGTLTPQLIEELKERKIELIEFLEGVTKTKERDQEIKVVEKKGYYKTSLIQQRMYIVNNLAGNKTPYNLSQNCILEGEINKIKMNEVVNELVKRHEGLRTSFRLIDGTLVQEVHDDVEVQIVFSYCDESEKDTILEKFIRPFDLNKAPILRVEIVSFSNNKHLFLSDTHHIVSDGTSGGLFLRDFVKLINDEPLNSLKIQFKDYVEWQYSKEGVEEISKQESYWLEQFKNQIPVMNMQTDYPRGSIQNFEGNYIHYRMDENIVKEIYRMIREEQVTLYIFLLASVNALLSKYTLQEDIIIGSPVAGRNYEGLQHVLGVFINALPMRNYPKKEYTFLEFLKKVKENTLRAYKNQNYQLGDLIEKLGIEADMNRNPMFDVELIVQNYEMTNIQVEGLNIIPQDSNLNVSQVDIAFFVIQRDDTFFINLNYCTKLFEASTMHKFLDNLNHIVEQVIENRNVVLSEIKLSKEYNEIETNYFIDEEADPFNF